MRDVQIGPHHITWDQARDTLYVFIQPGEISTSLHPTPNLMIDVDPSGSAVGVEILFK